MSVAQTLIIEAVRAGVLLYPEHGRLRYKALTTMPSGLASRLRSNKSDVLAVLGAADNADIDTHMVSTVDIEMRQGITAQRVSQVALEFTGASESEMAPVNDATRTLETDSADAITTFKKNAAAALYSPKELMLLCAVSARPGDLPTVDLIKAMFAQPSAPGKTFGAKGRGYSQECFGRHFRGGGVPGATLVDIWRDPTCPPRKTAARLIRHARRAGDHEHAVSLRDAWQERVAICTIDGELNQVDAEQIALREVTGLNVSTASRYSIDNAQLIG